MLSKKLKNQLISTPDDTTVEQKILVITTKILYRVVCSIHEHEYNYGNANIILTVKTKPLNEALELLNAVFYFYGLDPD